LSVVFLSVVFLSVSSSVSSCGMGDRCAMKFGPRIGKLCDCGRGANCNSYLLKCI
ncbi:cocaine- and amphetamine-regulated transcript-like, partial [Cheilinus undulatus]|uniref:cocaine- and amphetamine-regulated transcript-like n=1 Tax=Cheilinus undulatus TaxID=241271 RepID=UPI001BD4C77B